ncbi:UPF0057-domain-containing protein [Cystobasidium minutum MCA 4210]|uniref:UPF0057-domain-containing protein n=1 Tax=Cystobasidium minutum MCA 4210 TaxID=1397322 RepID=UPI0034CFD937|eukprot:jgi/Rhomi1/180830/fgenesh1_pg.5_\
MAEADVSDMLLIIIALFLPPVTALFTDGCGGQFCINILLTILGFIPGLIHAIWLVYRQARVRDARGPRYANDNNRPSHYVAVNPPPQQQPQQAYGQQQHPYGQQVPPPPEPVSAPYQQSTGYARPQYQAHGKTQ